MGWYKKTFGSDYIKIYSHRNENEAKKIISFAIQILELSPGSKVLDLACGYGRNTVECAKKHLNVTGLDLSMELLLAGREKDLASPKPIPFVQADMRFLPFKQPFDAVLSLFTSFGYFESDAENEQVIHGIASVLKPGGRFLLDFINVPQALATLNNRDEQITGKLLLLQERWYNKETDRFEKKITMTDNGDIRIYHESVRAYRIEDLLRFFKNAGIQNTFVFGDYDGSAFTPVSPRLLLAGIKI